MRLQEERKQWRKDHPYVRSLPLLVRLLEAVLMHVRWIRASGHDRRRLGTR